MQDQLSDAPTIEIGKTTLTKELSDQIGILPLPFDMFGIKSKKDFMEVVSSAASEIISISEVEDTKNLSRQKTKTALRLNADGAYEASVANNERVDIENRLLKAKFILKELFSNRDVNARFDFIIKLPENSKAVQQMGYMVAHISLEGEDVRVTGTFE